MRLPRRKWVYPLKGRTIKQAIADALSDETGRVITDDSLKHNNPYEICYEGRCSWASWDCNSWGWNIHSWDSMKDCLKYGFGVSEDGCVTAKDNDWNQKQLMAEQERQK